MSLAAIVQGMLRPTGRRILVLHPINRRRFVTGLYKGFSHWGNISGPQWVYIVSLGPDVKTELKKGDKVLLEDGLVLFDGDIPLWDELRDDDTFAALRKEQEQTDCDVIGKLVLENALLAVDTGEDGHQATPTEACPVS